MQLHNIVLGSRFNEGFTWLDTESGTVSSIWFSGKGVPYYMDVRLEIAERYTLRAVCPESGKTIYVQHGYELVDRVKYDGVNMVANNRNGLPLFHYEKSFYEYADKSAILADLRKHGFSVTFYEVRDYVIYVEFVVAQPIETGLQYLVDTDTEKLTAYTFKSGATDYHYTLHTDHYDVSILGDDRTAVAAKADVVVSEIEAGILQPDCVKFFDHKTVPTFIYKV